MIISGSGRPNHSTPSIAAEPCHLFSKSVSAQLGHVPAKLNTVVQPLMGGLRREADPVVREAVASAVAQLVILCTDRTPSPNDRHITVTFLLCSQLE